MSMPPGSEWYRGRDSIRAIFAWAWKEMGYSAYRVVETAANGQPAFALYARRSTDSHWHAQALQVLTLEGNTISALTYFLNTDLFDTFALPVTLPA